MRSSISLLPLVVTVCFAWPAQSQTPSVETVIFVRHGEKPSSGLGQLSCKGLNRALALPAVIRARYKKLDAVFAPDPSHEKEDGAASFDYVRPLATVEPTAISFGLPIEAGIGFEEEDKLRAALLDPKWQSATILVGWEHHQLNHLVPKFVAETGGDASQIPKWQRDDFDSIWKVTITRNSAGTSSTFLQDQEHLDGQPDLCPNAAAPALEQASPLVLEHK